VTKQPYYQLGVDGKELLGTVPNGHKHTSVQICSAWMHEVSASMNQARISEKNRRD
jgi:hypothetical protein